MLIQRTKALLLGLLLLTALTTHSQVWAPVQKDKTYYYQADTTDHITHQLQVDSTYSQNSNQVHLLNTGLQRCDTCSADNLPVVGNIRDIDTIYYHIDHPFFWQRKVVDSQNRYYFYGNRDFILAPDAPKDNNWPFRPGGNVTASIDSLYQTSIFGRSDSVKRIRLSNGQTLLLTKNHGILKFPKVQDGVRYRLTGTGGTKQLGNTLGFKAFYDFQVGDMFQYEASGAYEPGQRYEGITIRYRITSRKARGDTLIYGVVYKSIEEWTARKKLEEGATTLKFYPGGRLPFGSKYEDPGYDQANRFPGEVLTRADSLEMSGRDVPPLIAIPDSVKMATSCQLTVDSNGLLTKTIGGDRGYGSGPLNYYRQAKGSIYLAQSVVRGSYSKEFKEGLGLTDHGWFIFEIGSSRDLVGYVKNGDTVGTVFSDAKFRAIGVDRPDQPSVKCYPNPVQQTLYLSNLSPAQVAEVLVINQMGQTVMEHRFTGTEGQISMQGLKQGMYILKVRQGRHFMQRKLLKQ